MIDKVSVKYGANDLELELAGQTVENVQANCADVLSLSPNAAPKVNGKNVSKKYVLKAGDYLEWDFPKSPKERIAELEQEIALKQAQLIDLRKELEKERTKQARIARKKPEGG